MKKAIRYGAIAIFAFVGIAHFLRLILKWPIEIGSWSIPLWVSGAAVIILGFLAVAMSFDW